MCRLPKSKPGTVACLWPPRLRLCHAMTLACPTTAAWRRAVDSGCHSLRGCAFSVPRCRATVVMDLLAACTEVGSTPARDTLRRLSGEEAPDAHGVLRLRQGGGGAPANRRGPSAAMSSAPRPRTFRPGSGLGSLLGRPTRRHASVGMRPSSPSCGEMSRCRRGHARARAGWQG